MTKFKYALLAAFTVLLCGCKMAILHPRGIIAASEKDLLITAVLLMLIVVIPVIFLTFVFAWKYRAGNSRAKYSPNWAHSTILEAIWWTIPCVIIAVLAVLTWESSHQLDPYRPLDVKGKPLVIQVIALDWKWLFIYPEQHIATVNKMQIPINVPVTLLITADAPMNSLEIPQLAGQIYAMAGMRTQLHLMATRTGNFGGFSANYSGAGFSDMKFRVLVSTKDSFDEWVHDVQHSPKVLSADTYRQLVLPSQKNPPEYFVLTEDNLFNDVLMKYMGPADMKAMHMDMNPQ